jgi:hypothetical protein
MLRGTQRDEYNGVALELKNTISIMDMDMRGLSEGDDDDEELE